ncbi:MAG: hypothetical protein A3J66_02140 [Candidatus Magasanikbacteria bacterium RIFCSPHIGHO2_02_FULL_47_14]|uniref:Peptidase M24 domain-containing protein n=1 Tax=Candidatus Magasanikbacteria bacterium RIFCSPHIGHO2_02_FULL_47_14 TaxID=1798680 RepID=A0A1F6MBI1_9BACT|nr:MAG: hypothetical protein A3J66_02140 [Candidatus Magasanikbacteria bacterium RIFCSPHIGHO2_02_FULL_47_14]
MRDVRVQKVRGLLKEKNASAFFVTNPKNVFYLAGFIGISPHEREATALITEEKVLVFLPKMYKQQGEALQKYLPDLELVVDHERYGLLTSFVRYVSTSDKILIEKNNLTLAEFEKISHTTQAQLMPETGVVESLRNIKDPEEVACIQKAVDISEQVLGEVKKLLAHQQLHSEWEVAHEMHRLAVHYGADGVGFDSIVASGKHAAEPHYKTGRHALQQNQCLLLDFGFTYHGYTADVTRTVCLGKAPKQFYDVYSRVKECADICIAACKPGTLTKELFDLSWNYFKKYSLEGYYLHSLGHGLGLDVHESPSLGSSQETVLKPGMVVTIEPGLYFAGEFGVRIEDDILITETGYRLLTKSTRALAEISQK